MRKFTTKDYAPKKVVVTKSGDQVDILYTERDNIDFPVIALINKKQVVCYTADGKYYKDKTSDNDLYFQ